MHSGTNLPAIGGYNQAVVLDAIRRAPDGVSRVEIAASTGLSAQTITNASRRLLTEGLVEEAGTTAGQIGKPRTLLRLRAQGRYAIGVQLDPSVITTVLLDLAGGVVEHARALAPVDPMAAIATIVDSVGDLLARSGVARDRLLGVGVATPGPIDAERGIVLNPPLMPGWHDVPLRDLLIERLGLPVLFEKDVTAAAVGERWTDPDGAGRAFAFFYYGTGTGMGLVVDGEVLRGASGNAGDSGHLLVGGTTECSCGRRGCLGNTVLPWRLVGDARGPESEAEAADVLARFAALAARADAGDRGARAVLDEAADGIATALVTVVNLLDLDHVVFGGPFWHPVSSYLLDRVPDAVRASPALVSVRELSFAESALGEDVAAVGAACLVLDHALSPRPSSLLIPPASAGLDLDSVTS
ncbi:ROK family transcriptional regulator [Agromyces sp. G08B096]|uniref:ROK family transcriptional regulator n=1 Tax=Agromyces sp. G08B096 TaxID=3156399 RepID=A0AAU7W4R3_9MICO